VKEDAVRGALLVALAAGAGWIPPLPAQQPVEAVSFLGDSLRRPPLAAEAEARMMAQLDSARRAAEADPASADAVIWLGRRTAYLGRYREAIAIFTDGIRKHPEDPRLYRHRGHRYITLRHLDQAIADFRRAAELVRGQPDQTEPDGQPNARNIPTSSLQSNIWYHYGLALYLKGDFAGALDAYRECLKVSTNPDMLVATSHWLYMTLRRLGRDAEAARVLGPITREMDIIENGEYHRLLLFYKGELPPDALLAGEAGSIGGVTAAYGVGNWVLYHGRRTEAERIFRRILATGTWAAFGYIAAEAELARGVTRDE
jgi:tetratricopeptide (TPR) repeat protein